MIFPRREEATNKELILTIIEIQGYLSRYGKSHTNWHETLNEVVARLGSQESKDKEESKYCDRNVCIRNEYNGVGCEDCEITKSEG